MLTLGLLFTTRLKLTNSNLRMNSSICMIYQFTMNNENPANSPTPQLLPLWFYLYGRYSEVYLDLYSRYSYEFCKPFITIPWNNFDWITRNGTILNEYFIQKIKIYCVLWHNLRLVLIDGYGMLSYVVCDFFWIFTYILKFIFYMYV